MTLPTACLVDDPPSYVAPKQTRPFFDDGHASPLPSEVIQAKAGDSISFRMPVVSEDAGEQLWAIMLEDYAGRTTFGLGSFLPPSTLDDTSRVFPIEWSAASNTPGCHRLTLRASHSANVDIGHYPELINPADSAEAYWWANVDVDPLDANKLTDCPSADRGSP